MGSHCLISGGGTPQKQDSHFARGRPFSRLRNAHAPGVSARQPSEPGGAGPHNVTVLGGKSPDLRGGGPQKTGGGTWPPKTGLFGRAPARVPRAAKRSRRGREHFATLKTPRKSPAHFARFRAQTCPNSAFCPPKTGLFGRAPARVFRAAKRSRRGRERGRERFATLKTPLPVSVPGTRDLFRTHEQSLLLEQQRNKRRAVGDQAQACAPPHRRLAS